ncbi:MAG: bifunctional phosphoribosyl-AMP cyclohydrolase/phosphoribosyl-ATP pyrophosphatase [Nitrospinae bacterium RIFCSPLOWO2_02_39_17]|nr:MAG: bifunctional phosphoribosyl-AMP cyclohydrolase/phosphoribosyl-ATP pyrophosphatase [Nitrospinae bacterium RIFCSPHIGHO2_12_FULL_39_42]OGW04476.1 MAG: bifunctional phosphoribosyl-AMP cyclohydrolase/phosphoribosyl-ATP pyrophosphatase [Nitrospinae bacterium RIFCSPLOWO2_02_39_17]OGW07622.1 MAG: bifunctional phosphoribosyl-AMP cyclohydrolase/phosphoribosyl-ATP pyrophosphatase [Nitrospinae bacterium RIFCSPLOWO2_12_39_15]OGW08729.1 MAG: bifunctional phosphoribosyl-AMP cyclohydrolase/phosphoribosy
MDIKNLKYDSNGLIPAVIQDWKNGDVLMLAYMNEEALRKTIETGYTHFWSRSRGKLWKKGETSGNEQFVKEISYDCDNDTLLVKVEQKGVACHTGNRTCFYSKLSSFSPSAFSLQPSAFIIDKIYEVIQDRKRNMREGSYVSSLFKNGRDKILKKISEEASEVVIGSKNEKKEEIVWEIADLWFHTLVLLGYHDITPEDIYRELQKRFGKSGVKDNKK